MHQGGVPVGADSVVIGGILGNEARGAVESQVVQLAVLLGVGQLHNVGGHLHAGVTVVAHAGVSHLSLAGGHDDDAVGRPDAVDGRRRSVFENSERLDVGAGEEVDVVHKCAVNHVQGLGIVADGAHAADLDAGACARSAALGDLHAAHHTGKCRHRVGGSLLRELVSLDVDYRGGKVLGLLGAVTHHHNLLQEGLVFGQVDQRGHFGSLEALGCVAHTADLDHCVGTGHREQEISVQARRCAVGRSGLHNCGAYHGPQFVLNYTLDLISLGGGRKADQQGACKNE